jgi:hypothetical protein
MKILGTMVGWKNVGIVREQLFKDEFELAHYAGKNFLFHPDIRWHVRVSMPILMGIRWQCTCPCPWKLRWRRAC